MAKKQKFDAKLASESANGHFYASSVAEWRTGLDPVALIALMQTGGFPFRVWWVPVSRDAHYKIVQYAPDVVGSVVVASYGFESYLEG